MKILRDTLRMLGENLGEILRLSLWCLFIAAALNVAFTLTTPGETTGTIPWMTIKQFSSPRCADCTYKPEQTVIYTIKEPIMRQVKENRWEITFKP